MCSSVSFTGLTVAAPNEDAEVSRTERSKLENFCRTERHIMNRFALGLATNRREGMLAYAAASVTLIIVLCVAAPGPADAQIPPRVNTLQVDRPLAGPAVSPVDRLRQDVYNAVEPDGRVDKRLLRRQTSTRPWVSVAPSGPPTQLLSTQPSTRRSVPVLPAEPPAELTQTQPSTRPGVRMRPLPPARPVLRVPPGSQR